jgi:AhpD family alkylhydroperoxidase
VRFDPYADAPEYAHLQSLHRELVTGPLPAPLRELVNVRVSQINGCGFCLALHARLARRSGIDQAVLDVLAGWRDSPLFDPQQRAALALAEAMARIGDGATVPADVWDNAAAVFDRDQLRSLLYAIALIDAYNRINITAELTADVDAFFKK